MTQLVAETQPQNTLAAGEISIVIDQQQNVRVFTATVDDGKPVEMFQMACIDAIIRCGTEDGFALECLEHGRARRRKAS
jgi:hypothetical protein